MADDPIDESLAAQLRCLREEVAGIRARRWMFFRAAAVVLLLCCAANEAVTESLTMTTYYPAPSGVYKRLTATDRVAIGGGAYTIISAPAGGMIVSGKVGIGMTTPNVALDVRGDINASATLNLGLTSQPICKEGRIYYDSTQHMFFGCSGINPAWHAFWGGASLGTNWVSYGPVTGSTTRRLGTTYTNDFSYPLLVLIRVRSNVNPGCWGARVYVNGIDISLPIGCFGGAESTTTFIVPVGGTYRVVAVPEGGSVGEVVQWAELQ